MGGGTAEVEAAAREVLMSSNLDELSERQLCALVRERTGVDTSLPDLKQLIHSVVEDFMAQEHGSAHRPISAAASTHERETAEAGSRGGGIGRKRKALSSGAEKGDGEEEEELKEEEEEEEAEEEESAGKKKRGSLVRRGGSKTEERTRRKFDVGDSGELVVCKLSGKRRVTVGQYQGKVFVNIREFYEKDGQERPGKGISLPVDQWEILSKHVEDVDLAIKDIKSS